MSTLALFGPQHELGGRRRSQAATAPGGHGTRRPADSCDAARQLATAKHATVPQLAAAGRPWLELAALPLA